MIEFEIKPQYYKEIHNTIFAVDIECKMEFTKQGIAIALVDPMNVLMNVVNIPKKAFESLKVNKNISIGYELKLFETDAEQKMFLNSKVNHTFAISQEDGLDDLIPITHAEIKHDIFVDTITLPDSNSIRKNIKVPKLDLPCAFELEVATLRKLIKRDDYVRFEIENGKLVCRGAPDWYTKPIAVKTDGVANSMFSSNYLKAVVKAIPSKVKSIKVNMGVDYPCTIEYNICDDMVPVKYLLSPRIESE